MIHIVASSVHSQPTFRQFICRACGLIYNEAFGDPDSGLEAGTRFEDIPDAWMCPICGVGKGDFEPYIAHGVGDRPAMAVRQSDINTGSGAHGGRNRRDHGVGGTHAPVVIIGAGIAGWSAAAAIRAQDATRPVTLVSACNGDVYSKPMLSVAFARGKAVENLITETGPAAAQRLNVRLVAEVWVSGIDSARQRVRSTRGSLEYSSLILALGATPSRLALDQGDAGGLPLLWRINHWQHYAAFRRALDGAGSENKSKRIVVIGAGLVGCELADDLAGAGHCVTLLEQADRLLPGLGSNADAARLGAAFVESGIRFIGDAQIQKIENKIGKKANGVSVHLANGECIEADIALSAAGLRVDKRLATSAGLTFDNGIAADAATMLTSQAHIYALGDCVSFGGKTMRFIEPIHQQAQTLAAAISGAQPKPFDFRSPIVRVKTRSLPMSLSLTST